MLLVRRLSIFMSGRKQNDQAPPPDLPSFKLIKVFHNLADLLQLLAFICVEVSNEVFVLLPLLGRGSPFTSGRLAGCSSPI